MQSRRLFAVNNLIFSLLIIPVGLLAWPVSCGLPQDEYVIFRNYVDSPISLSNAGESVLFENRDETRGRDPYDPSKVKGYNFFYRIYTEDDYISMAGGADTYNEEIRDRIETEARTHLSQSNQHKLASQENFDSINTISRPYYRFVSVNKAKTNPKESKQDPNKLGIHYEAPVSDFQISVGISDAPILVEYKFVLPTEAEPFAKVIKFKYNNRLVDSKEQKPVYLYRRVFDDTKNKFYAKNFWGELDYRMSSSDSSLVKPDEDISVKEINRDTNTFYVAYFVALTGTQITPTLKPLNSDVSLLCVQKMSSAQMRQNPDNT